MDLDELYQSVILDHSRRPRNKGPLPGATHRAEGNNPSCGDEVSVEVIIADGKIVEINFMGQGCAISQSAASLMTIKLKGKSLLEAERLTTRFHSLVTDQPETTQLDELEPGLGDLVAFRGVRRFPQRVKCATLAWNAVREIFRGQS